MRDAEKVDRAILLFARTGEGQVERVSGAPTGLWLKAPPYTLRLSLDAPDHMIVVWWVGRAGSQSKPTSRR